MPGLSFRVTGVEPASRGLVPLLHFEIEVSNSPETELIQAIICMRRFRFNRLSVTTILKRRRNWSSFSEHQTVGAKPCAAGSGLTRMRRFDRLRTAQTRFYPFTAHTT
jgi:hypothetical protein